MIPMSDEIVAQKALIFGKYDTSEVVVNDGGLAKYIDLTPTNVPHSGGKHANRWFGKSKLSIVERLINNIMRTEKYTGKKMKAYKTVAQAFDIVAAKTHKNPVQVLIEGLENAAPREEVTRLQFGGISVPKAVDISPQRRGTSAPVSSRLPPRTRNPYTSAWPTSSCSPPRVTSPPTPSQRRRRPRGSPSPPDDPAEQR